MNKKTIDHIIADVSKVQIEVSSNDQLSASTEDASEMPSEKSFVSSVNEITNNAALILNDTLDYQAQPSSNTIVDTDIIKHTESDKPDEIQFEPQIETQFEPQIEPQIETQIETLVTTTENVFVTNEQQEPIEAESMSQTVAPLEPEPVSQPELEPDRQIESSSIQSNVQHESNEDKNETTDF